MMSIWGNPITLGSSGGGLSSSDAILVVTVPTGSTVTATKGGVTLTPTMWVQAADNTFDYAIFSIKASLFDAVNPWTVTATLGTDTASDTVVIDSNKEYDLELSYYFYFIRNGIIQDSFTPSASSGVTFESDYQGQGYTRLYAPTSGSQTNRFGLLSPAFDFGNGGTFSTLKVDCEIPEYFASYQAHLPRVGFGGSTLSDAASAWDATLYLGDTSSTPVARATFSLDVSSQTGNLYLKLMIRSSTAKTADGRYYNIWLER